MAATSVRAPTRSASPPRARRPSSSASSASLGGRRRGRRTTRGRVGGRALRASCTPLELSPRRARTLVAVDRRRADRRRRRRRSAAADDTALACLQTRQPRGRHAAAGRRGRGGLRARPACRCSSTPPSPSAGCRSRRRAGRSLLTASAHKWGGPAGVGVLAVRHGRPLALARAGRRARGPAGSPGFENVPAILAAAAALEAVSRRARPRGRPPARARRPAPRRGCPTVARRRGGRRPGRAAPAPRDLLLPLRRRRGAAHRARPRGVRRVKSGSSCTASTLEPSHVLEAMGVLTHGNVRVSLPRDIDAGRRRAASSPCCPVSSGGCAPRPGRSACDRARSTRVGSAARCRSSTWPGRMPRPRPATVVDRARRRPGGRDRHRRLVPHARPRVPGRRTARPGDALPRAAPADGRLESSARRWAQPA